MQLPAHTDPSLRSRAGISDGFPPCGVPAFRLIDGELGQVKAKRPVYCKPAFLATIVMNYLVVLEFVRHTQADPEFVIIVDRVIH